MDYCIPFEMNCRGYIAQSTVVFMSSLGIVVRDMRKLFKDLNQDQPGYGGRGERRENQ